MNTQQIMGAGSLEKLIRQASDMQGQTRLLAVEALKKMRLSQMDAHDLCQFFSVDLHPSIRATAAQVLGYHKASKRYAEVMADVLRWAHKERDPLTLKALVFALGGTEGAADFLGHSKSAVAVEAVVGMPEKPEFLRAFLEVLFRETPEEVVGAICCRLGHWGGASEGVVAFLMTAEIQLVGKRFSDRVKQIFAVLSQADVLGFLTDVSGDIQRTYTQIWPGIWRRERQRSLLEIFVQTVQENGASEALLEALILRIFADEIFYNRYVRFIRALLKDTDLHSAQILIQWCEKVGNPSKREGLRCLAEVLVEVVRSNPDLSGRVQDILGRWETHLPGIRLKAFHATR